jgi:hypothetical protein
MMSVNPRRIEWMDPRLPDHFWSKVKRMEEHWIWGGGRFDNGYGKVKRSGKTWRVHRLIYAMSYGNPPAHVLHHCDVPLCIKPRHLFDGTHQDNMDDMMLKDRSCRGQRNTKAKLTDSDIIRIKKEYATGGIRQIDLARRYGVHQTAISHIVTGRTWKHINQ